MNRLVLVGHALACQRPLAGEFLGSVPATAYSIMRFLSFTLAALFPLLAASAQPGFPFTDESLRYNLNWQAGTSLGEATLTAHRSAVGWNLDATLNAAVPGFSMADQLHSAVDPGLCSQEFERDLTHGGKRTDEMVRALKDLLVDAELRSRMERLGQQRAAQFSWQKTADSILEVFREVAHQRQPAALASSRSLAHR